MRRVDDAYGFSAARLSALSVVVFGGPTALGRLARAEQVSAPTMSKLVDALEREGLVTREPDERDRRAVVVAATEEGKRILVEGRRRRIEELARLFEELSSGELDTLDEAAAIVERQIARPPSV